MDSTSQYSIIEKAMERFYLRLSWYGVAFVTPLYWFENGPFWWVLMPMLAVGVSGWYAVFYAKEERRKNFNVPDKNGRAGWRPLDPWDLFSGFMIGIWNSFLALTPAVTAVWMLRGGPW